MLLFYISQAANERGMQKYFEQWRTNNKREERKISLKKRHIRWSTRKAWAEVNSCGQRGEEAAATTISDVVVEYIDTGLLWRARAVVNRTVKKATATSEKYSRKTQKQYNYSHSR